MLVRTLEVDDVIGKAVIENSIFYLIKWKEKPVTCSTWKHRSLLTNIKKRLT